MMIITMYSSSPASTVLYGYRDYGTQEGIWRVNWKR